MKDNIVLIGFMGVGKGSVARELSKKMGKFALDTDDLIQSAQNRKIKEIFKKDGEKYFRELESDLAKFLQNCVKDAIISTGGGFYKVKNLEKIGKVIYLKSPFDSIISRMKSSPNAKKKFEKRPLLKDLKKAKELFDVRCKEYEKKADFVVVVKDKPYKKIALEIIKLLKGKK